MPSDQTDPRMPAVAGQAGEEQKTAEEPSVTVGVVVEQAAEATGLADSTLGVIGDMLGSVGSAAANAAQGLGQVVSGLMPSGEPAADAAGAVTDAAADAAGEAAGSILDLFG